MVAASVVIVNYNSGGFLEACVQSVLSSDCSLQIVIVNNASTDDSLNFLRDFVAVGKTLRVIRNEKNDGFSAGINLGVENSNCDN